MDIFLKRAYEDPAPSDGFRVLVDKLWPRGRSRARLKIGLWYKAAAPSNALRKWFHHEGGSWEEFQRRYREELAADPETLRGLDEAVKGEARITLVYGAKDPERNQAVVLRDLLRGRQGK